ARARGADRDRRREFCIRLSALARVHRGPSAGGRGYASSPAARYPVAPGAQFLCLLAVALLCVSRAEARSAPTSLPEVAARAPGLAARDAGPRRNHYQQLVGKAEVRSQWPAALSSHEEVRATSPSAREDG